MRDGSLDDVVGTYVARIVDEYEGRLLGDHEAAVYFSLLKHAAIGLEQAHQRFRPDTDYRTQLRAVLGALHNALPTQVNGGDEALLPEPDLAELLVPPEEQGDQPRSEPGAQEAREGSASYWGGDSWKKDFYTSFSRWFWDMKDYALPAGRRKADFLWDVAEVWVATAPSALVYYAKDDRTRWFETAQMLRYYANLTEADGLRSLPWGRWGRHAKGNHRPKSPARATGSQTGRPAPRRSDR
ncbi:MAG: hypothetical protein JWR80_873 [Bradyrhizobium sp.]|nr:hypothetical protein [Bradyrhizobium sp.]